MHPLVCLSFFFGHSSCMGTLNCPNGFMSYQDAQYTCFGGDELTIFKNVFKVYPKQNQMETLEFASDDGLAPVILPTIATQEWYYLQDWK